MVSYLIGVTKIQILFSKSNTFRYNLKKKKYYYFLLAKVQQKTILEQITVNNYISIYIEIFYEIF